MQFLKRHTVLFSVYLSILLMLIGCGSGSNGGSSDSAEHAPTISNLQFAPQSAEVGESRGAVRIKGVIDYIDQEGNITSMTINTPQGTETRHVSGIDGEMYGTIQGACTFDTTVAGNFAFTMYVTDSTGLKSNELTAIFTVN